MAYCVPHGIPHSSFLEWDPTDQDKALAYMREERKTCRCGSKPEEWEKDRFAYVGQQRYCPGCEVLEQERQNVPDHAQGYTHIYLAPAEFAKPPDEE